MKLAELQKTFADVIMDEALADELLEAVHGDGRASAEERLSIYANMYVARLVEVLGEVYCKCRERLGERFDERATAYVRAQPSRSPSLRQFGHRFAEWLDGATAALAQLEWTRYDVFDAADDEVLTRAALVENVATVTLELIRASRIVTLAYPAQRAYDDPRVELDERETTLLVWRQGPKVFHRVLDEDELSIVRSVDGRTLTALCETIEGDVQGAAQKVFALVGRWLADELLRA